MLKVSLSRNQFSILPKTKKKNEKKISYKVYVPFFVRFFFEELRIKKTAVEIYWPLPSNGCWEFPISIIAGLKDGTLFSWTQWERVSFDIRVSIVSVSKYIGICIFILSDYLLSRLKCLGGVPVLWSKWLLASSLLQAIKTCHQACPPGYLMHFS